MAARKRSAPAKAAAAGDDPPIDIASVRIELLHTDPPIWREVEVPTAISLAELHFVVQSVMPWGNDHLWEFSLGRHQTFGPPDEEEGVGEAAATDAAKVRLEDVLRPSKTVLRYLYDFGDSWEHNLTVTHIRPAQPGIAYPRYVAGEGNAPPEDCGGVGGFCDMLDARADRKHPDHAQAKEWLGDYDPLAIDTTAIERSLKYLAERVKPRKARHGKPGA